MARLSPYAKDPNSHAAGTGGPSDGTFKNLATGETEKRFNGGNILDENISRDTNAPGTLSMANTGSKNTGRPSTSPSDVARVVCLFIF